MHHNPLIRLIKDILHSRTNIIEQPHWVTQEIRRSQYSIQLRDELFSIMEDDPFLQRGDGDSSVVNEEGVETDRGGVDVAEGHSEGVEEEDDGVAGADSERQGG